MSAPKFLHYKNFPYVKQAEIVIKRLLAVNNNQLSPEEHFFQYFVNKIHSNLLSGGKCFPLLNEHNFDLAPYVENHVTKLIKVIVNIYVRIRFFNLAKRQTELVRGELVRKKFKKTCTFSPSINNQ